MNKTLILSDFEVYKLRLALELVCENATRLNHSMVSDFLSKLIDFLKDEEKERYESEDLG